MRSYLSEFRTYPLWLKIVLPTSAMLFLLAWVAQMGVFPDNPIFPKNGVYLGKYGTVYTQAQYHRFILFNRIQLMAACALFAGFFSSVVLGQRSEEHSSHRDGIPH